MEATIRITRGVEVTCSRLASESGEVRGMRQVCQVSDASQVEGTWVKETSETRIRRLFLCSVCVLVLSVAT